MHLRYALEHAALAAGLPEDDARRVGPHDLRHAAITDLVTRPGVSLGGAAYLAGHRHVSTTALYSHPGEEAAEEAIRARIGIPGRDTAKKPKRPKKK
jgi:site-specific recombinase XerD